MATIVLRNVFFELISFLALLWLSAPIVGAQESFHPNRNPVLQVTRTAQPIKVDGNLDDLSWRDAGKTSDFTEHSPGVEIKPPVRTEAFITYDNENLYVAVICYDDPKKVRATYCNRDEIYNDDNIGIFLDTYGDAAWAYTLNVNPYGLQADALWGANQGEDSGYDLIWKSAGKITDSGYQVEVAIPFSSLRFPNQPVQTWKLEIYRHHYRESHYQISSVGYDPNESCWPCQWGTLLGIENVQPGKGLALVPSVIGYQSGARIDYDNPQSEFENEKFDGEMSVGAQYSPTSNITAEITYNPDFSQVEADAEQIDVNTVTALSFPEKRPFFQEGSDLFRTYFTSVYTRSINDPEVAVKGVARINRTSIAFLSARDEHSPIIIPFNEMSGFALAGKSVSNLLRLRNTLGSGSQIGMIATDRRFDDGGSGTLIGLDGLFRISKSYELMWQYLTTNIKEPDDTALSTDVNGILFDRKKHTADFDGESFWGHGYFVGFERSALHWNFEIDYYGTTPTFRADNGFEPKDDYQIFEFSQSYVIYPKSKLIRQSTPMIDYERQWDFAGHKKYESINIGVLSSLSSQTDLHQALILFSENYTGIQFNNLWQLHFCASSNFSRYMSVDAAFNYGHQIARIFRVKGSETSASFCLELKPTNKLKIESNIEYDKSNDLDTDMKLFEGYVFWTNINYHLTRELSIRLLAQHNDFSRTWDVDPLVTFQLGPFSALYAGATHDFRHFNGLGDDMTYDKTALMSRQYFMKLQYMFQI
jgi:hypothetical protein